MKTQIIPQLSKYLDSTPGYVPRGEVGRILSLGTEDGDDIEFRVSISIGDRDDLPWWIQRLFSSVNYIEITNEDDYRSKVYGKGGGKGTWWANANEWVYAHEMGHLA